MTFYVIGNGFDLHYGLNTRYDHFKNYLIYNGYSDLIKKVDSLFYDAGKFLPNEIKKWSKFEDMLESFNNLDAEYIYDEFTLYELLKFIKSMLNIKNIIYLKIKKEGLTLLKILY